MGAIPGAETDYFYATYDRSGDAARGCKPMIINPRIMPLRNNSAILEIDSKRCMRGVDVMFLAEAVATRQAIAPVSDGQPLPGTLAMTPDIKMDRLIDINNCTAQQWNTWAALSGVDYGSFAGANLGVSRTNRDNLVRRLKTEIGFSAGIGTQTHIAEDDFNFLLIDVVQTLFKNIAKKQCCVIPLVGATYTVDGSDTNVLAYFTGCKHGPVEEIDGPNYASTIVVNHTFPPAAGGSRLMLFAYSGGHSWKANDYPSDQDNGEDAFCLVPTDGTWHEVSSDGTFTAELNARTVTNNIVSACAFGNPFPEVPQDSDPESTKNRQASWDYFLMSSNNIAQNAATFFALFDLDHTNLGHTILAN